MKPQYKSGGRDSFQNYRPILITAIFCGILEKTLANRVRLHFEENGLWSETENAYRQKCLCSKKLFGVVKDFQQFADKGDSFDCIYFKFPYDW